MHAAGNSVLRFIKLVSGVLQDSSARMYIITQVNSQKTGSKQYLPYLPYLPTIPTYRTYHTYLPYLPTYRTYDYIITPTHM